MRPPEQREAVQRLYASNLTTPEVAARTGIPLGTLTAWLRAAGLIRSSAESRNINPLAKRKVPLSFTFEPLTNDTAWVLGLIVGDGNIHKSGNTVRISSGDLDVLQKVRCITGGSPSIHKLKLSICHEISLNARRIVRELGRAGIAPNKAATVRFPTLSSGLARHFIRGLVDSDGCWHVTRSGSLIFVYSSKSLGLIEDLREALLSNLPISVTPQPRRTLNNNFRLEYSHKDSITIGNWLYADPESPRCARKFATFEKGRKHRSPSYRTPSDKADIVLQYRAGLRAIDIRATTGASVTCVFRYLREAGVKSRKRWDYSQR